MNRLLCRTSELWYNNSRLNVEECSIACIKVNKIDLIYLVSQ